MAMIAPAPISPHADDALTIMHPPPATRMDDFSNQKRMEISDVIDVDEALFLEGNIDDDDTGSSPTSLASEYDVDPEVDMIVHALASIRPHFKPKVKPSDRRKSLLKAAHILGPNIVKVKLSNAEYSLHLMLCMYSWLRTLAVICEYNDPLC